MALKIVVFYSQFTQGWTETYYLGGSTQPFALLDNLSTRVMNAFVTFRHSSVTLIAVRASVVGSPRVTYLKYYSDSSDSSGKVIPNLGGAPPVQSSDVTSTAMIAQLTTTPGSVIRHIAVRGLNDQDVVRAPNGASTPSAYLSGGMDKMVSTLKTLGWSVQTEQRPPVGGSVWTSVSSVAAVNSTQTTLDTLTAPNLNLAINPQIVFQGVPRDDLPGFPRLATVIAQSNVAPFSITVSYRYRASVTPYIPAKMKFTSVVNIYTPITNWQLIDFNERKTGRPFGVPRGRSRAVVRAQ